MYLFQSKENEPTGVGATSAVISPSGLSVDARHRCTFGAAGPDASAKRCLNKSK